MDNEHCSAGYKAAQQGAWRAAPKALKIVSPEWKAWYAGFDAGVKAGEHSGLDDTFSARRGVKVTGKRVIA